MTETEREAWIFLYEMFRQSVNFPPEWEGDEDKREVVAHNLALRVVWASQTDKLDEALHLIVIDV